MDEQEKFYAEVEAELAKHPKPAPKARRRKPVAEVPASTGDEKMDRFRSALAAIMTVPKEEVNRLVAAAKRKKDKLGEKRYRT